MHDFITRIGGIFKKPITYVLLFNTVLFCIGITWGLPNVETWMADSLAPFHPLIGLSKGFSFGYFNKYPIIHQLILAILNIPVVIAAIIESNPLEGLQLFKFLVLMRSADYATALILIDNMVSVVMGVLTVYFVYLSGRELFNERTGLFAAAVASFNAVLNFYSHTAKVEVPYVFWAIVSLYFLIKVVRYDQTRDYIACAVFACFSFGTKDQGYAIFVLPFILYLVVYQAVYREPGVSLVRVIFRKRLLLFVAAFIIAAVLAQNLWNIQGFMERYRLLTGDAGQRAIGYSYAPAGIIALLYDSTVAMIRHAMGLPIFLLCVLGIALVCYEHRRDRKKLFFSLFMIFPALSYYLFFIQFIRQSEVRYSLPQSIFISVYGGFAVCFLYEKLKGNYRKALSVALVLIGLYSFYKTFSINANMLFDVRYSAEEWMRAHVPKGSTIEYYAYLHYLPRFPEGTSSYRIKKGALDIESRKPGFLVLSSHYYPRFLIEVHSSGGRIRTIRNIRERGSEFAVFFERLFANELNYRLVHRAERRIPFFETIDSPRISPQHILIFERVKTK